MSLVLSGPEVRFLVAGSLEQAPRGVQAPAERKDDASQRTCLLLGGPPEVGTTIRLALWAPGCDTVTDNTFQVIA